MHRPWAIVRVKRGGKVSFYLSHSTGEDANRVGGRDKHPDQLEARPGPEPWSQGSWPGSLSSVTHAPLPGLGTPAFTVSHSKLGPCPQVAGSRGKQTEVQPSLWARPRPWTLAAQLQHPGRGLACPAATLVRVHTPPCLLKPVRLPEPRTLSAGDSHLCPVPVELQCTGVSSQDCLAW